MKKAKYAISAWALDMKRNLTSNQAGIDATTVSPPAVFKPITNYKRADHAFQTGSFTINWIVHKGFPLLV